MAELPQDDDPDPIPLAEETFLCLGCGKPFKPRGGETTCPGCMHRVPEQAPVVIDLDAHDEDDAPRCRRCKYDLRATPIGGVCPECGLARGSGRARASERAVGLDLGQRPARRQPADAREPIAAPVQRRMGKLRPPVCDQCGADMRGMPIGAKCALCGEGVAIAYHPRDTAGSTLMASGVGRARVVLLHALGVLALAAFSATEFYLHWWWQVDGPEGFLGSAVDRWGIVLAWGAFTLAAVILASKSLDPPSMADGERRDKRLAIVGAAVTLVTLAIDAMLSSVPLALGALFELLAIIGALLFVIFGAGRLRSIAAWTGHDPSDAGLIAQAGPTLLGIAIVALAYLLTHFFRRGLDASDAFGAAIAAWLLWRSLTLAWHAWETVGSRKVRDERRARERASGPPVPPGEGTPSSTEQSEARRRISSRP